MSDPVKDELIAARVDMLFNREIAFVAHVALHLELKEVDWVKTGATDGKFLYYNREFIKSLTREQVIFFVAHETFHVMYLHFMGRGNRNKDLYNMALDYNVNYSLIKEGIGEKIKNILYDERYTDNMSAYEIYDILEEKCVKIQMPLDFHLDLDGDGDSKDNEKGKNGNAEITVFHDGDGPPTYSKEELEELKEELKASMINAAQQAGGLSAGSIPAGLRRILKDLLEPKLDWKSLLDVYIKSSIKDDYTFQKIGRRTWGNSGIIFPGQNNAEKVEVFCAIDASASTTEEMVTDFLTEITGIMNCFHDYVLHIFSFDTQVYNYKVITPENEDEAYAYEISGNGGTMFECVFDFLEENDLLPERLIIFTDGYPNDTWGNSDFCDTMFVIHSGPTITAPFGLTTHYEKHQ